MVQSKTNLFDDHLGYKARLFKALSHPARLDILQFLAQTQTCITGDISDQMPLGRTTVNQHLKELKDIGLIVGNTTGVSTNYCLNPKKVNEVSQLLINFFERLKMNKCC